MKVVIADPETKGHCADSHLGEVRLCLCVTSVKLPVFRADKKTAESWFHVEKSSTFVKSRNVPVLKSMMSLSTFLSC